MDYQIVDNCKKGLGYKSYNVVPPPYIGNFMPLTPDLSFTGLDEFVNKPVFENSNANSSEEETKAVRKNDDASIIEEWGNPHMDLQVLGVFDSGCSRYMTGNMSYLTDYKEIDGRYIAFGGNPKEGKIIEKCTIETDHLGKFDGKADEGFFVRYSLNSKAFSVFNSRTKIVEENLHIRFSESTPIVVGSRPDWLFDTDALTRTMNYEPIVASTQSNGFVGTKTNDIAGQARKEINHVKDYILLPLWTADLPFSQDSKSSHDDESKPSSDDGKKVDEDSKKENECNDLEKEDNNVNCTNNVNTVSSIVKAAGINKYNELPIDPNMPALEDVSIFNFSNEDEDDGLVADINNLDTTIQVSPILTTRIHKDHPFDQVIGDSHSTTQTRNISKNLEKHGFVSTIQQRTNHKDL
nr:ribonuclease H-like domain-containing protein [Tanacetum cinerariifolium]